MSVNSKVFVVLMNPSYFRIHVAKDDALRRFAAWTRLAEIGPLVPTNISDAVELACDEQGRWLGSAVFVSEIGDWTLFQDLSGALSGIHHDSWLKFAGSDQLVFAGYNDAILYGEIIVVGDGSVIRVFTDDADLPERNLNIGKLEENIEPEPFHSWIEVASFVDADELAFSETGWLWVFP